MSKIAVVVLADTESHADHGRFTNAIELAKEAKEEGDQVQVIFDGAGTRWIPMVTQGNGPMQKMFASVKEVVTGACAFCAAAFEVKEAIEKTDVPLLAEYEGHPSLRRLIADGYTVVTF